MSLFLLHLSLYLTSPFTHVLRFITSLVAWNVKGTAKHRRQPLRQLARERTRLEHLEEPVLGDADPVVGQRGFRGGALSHPRPALSSSLPPSTHSLTPDHDTDTLG